MASKQNIPGVSILTIGPALGHGIQIDRKGLEMSLSCLKQRGTVKLTVKHDGEFDDICGKVSNFRIDGDQIKGDIEFFSAHPAAQKFIEIASAMPSEFGLSIESFGTDEDMPNGKGKWFRPSDIDAIALVPRPAANPRGLFGALVRHRKPSNFAELVEQKRHSGFKNPFVAAVLENPESYNEYRAAIENPNKVPSSLTAKFEAAISKRLSSGIKSRGAAVLRVAAEDPELYNKYRAAGGV